MNKKLILALSFTALACNAYSASLFDVSLAKKCYAIAKRLTVIKDSQTLYECRYKLSHASSDTESAALDIALDKAYAREYLDDAIMALKHAQMYSCINEEGILAEEQNLLAIKAQFNP
ncbi:MAG: hypothetical protein ACRC0B_01490 [Legionella sp.]